MEHFFVYLWFLYCLDFGKVVDLLVKNGIDVNQKDLDGKGQVEY